MPNIILFVKHMTGDPILQEQLDRNGLKNSNKTSAFVNIFSDWYTWLSSGIPLAIYKVFARGNWDNYNSADSDTCETDYEKNENAIENGYDQTGDEDFGGFPEDDPEDCTVLTIKS